MQLRLCFFAHIFENTLLFLLVQPGKIPLMRQLYGLRRVLESYISFLPYIIEVWGLATHFARWYERERLSQATWSSIFNLCLYPRPVARPLLQPECL